MRTPPSPAHPERVPAGWADTGTAGTWRDNLLNLVPYTLLRRTVSGGQAVTVPASASDFLVLLKPHTARSGAAP